MKDNKCNTVEHICDNFGPFNTLKWGFGKMTLGLFVILPKNLWAQTYSKSKIKIKTLIISIKFYAILSIKS